MADNAHKISYDAIIVASGKGRRTGLDRNKVFCVFPDGETVLQKAMNVFLRDDDCRKVVVVLSEEDRRFFRAEGKVAVCLGGKERMDSVERGLEEVTAEYVMVHDGARPYLKEEEVERLKEALCNSDGAILSLPVRDSLKYGEGGRIRSSVARENLYLAQTPQAFRTAVLRQAYRIKKTGVIYSDEASLCEETGAEILLVRGSLSNIKITYPEDLPQH